MQDILQNAITYSIDSILVLEEQSSTVSYVKIVQPPPALVTEPVFDMLFAGFEYLSLFVISVLVMDVAFHYKRNLHSLFGVFKSSYLRDRFIHTRSVSTNQLSMIIITLIIVSEALLFSRLVPTDVLFSFNDNTIFRSLSIPIYTTVLFLLQLLNNTTFRMNRFFDNSRDKAVVQVSKLNIAFNILEFFVVAMLLIFSYITEWNNIFDLLFMFFLSYLFLFLSSMIMAWKIFYKENFSFYQYILYFCTVKSIKLIFLMFILWSNISNNLNS